MNNNLGPKLIKAGFLPLPAWLGITTIAGFLAKDYSPIASHVSVMTLQNGVAHTLANIAALSSGIALIVFGIGIWLTSKRVFSGGAFCWILFGISMVANGIWPMGGPMHGLYIIGIFSVIAPALGLLDVEDKIANLRLKTITTFCSLVAVLYIWILLNGFDPEGFSGVTQRIFGSINYLWPLLLALRTSRSNIKPAS